MKKVLCIGSVTTDVIVSPADSVPTPGTLRAVDSVTTHVGGCAANAAIDLGRLGVPRTVLGISWRNRCGQAAPTHGGSSVTRR